MPEPDLAELDTNSVWTGFISQITLMAKYSQNKPVTLYDAEPLR